MDPASVVADRAVANSLIGELCPAVAARTERGVTHGSALRTPDLGHSIVLMVMKSSTLAAQAWHGGWLRWLSRYPWGQGEHWITCSMDSVCPMACED